MCRGVVVAGRWSFPLLDDRSGPPVRDDERQCVFVVRADVNEVNIQPIDLGHELRQGVQLRLALAPMMCGPVAREFLHPRGSTPCESSVTVSRPGHFAAFMRLRRSKFCFRNIHMKRTNSRLIIAHLLCAFSHSFGPPAKPVMARGVRSPRPFCRPPAAWGTRTCVKTAARFPARRTAGRLGASLVLIVTSSWVVCPNDGQRGYHFCHASWRRPRPPGPCLLARPQRRSRASGSAAVWG